MACPLENLAGPGGPLVAEPPDDGQIQGLRRSGFARLKDARNTALSLEARFDIAYNAAHALCLAALRNKGYRARNRYIVFQVLPHTLGVGAEVWRVLARAHDLRNVAEYQGELDVEERLIIDVIAACEAVASRMAKADPTARGA